MSRLLDVLFGIVRFSLGAVLLVSGIQKLLSPYDFLSAVYAYELTGPTDGLAVAAILPWCELGVGMCLLAGVCTYGAFLAALVLASVFVYAQFFALNNELGIACGCFLSDAESVGTLSIARALLVWAGAAIGLSLVLLKKRPAKEMNRGDALG